MRVDDSEVVVVQVVVPGQERFLRLDNPTVLRVLKHTGHDGIDVSNILRLTQCLQLLLGDLQVDLN